ncbi:unnamed protein product, partial [Owenia fusiformis]
RIRRRNQDATQSRPTSNQSYEEISSIDIPMPTSAAPLLPNENLPSHSDLNRNNPATVDLHVTRDENTAFPYHDIGNRPRAKTPRQSIVDLLEPPMTPEEVRDPYKNSRFLKVFNPKTDKKENVYKNDKFHKTSSTDAPTFNEITDNTTAQGLNKNVKTNNQTNPTLNVPEIDYKINDMEKKANDTDIKTNNRDIKPQDRGIKANEPYMIMKNNQTSFIEHQIKDSDTNGLNRHTSYLEAINIKDDHFGDLENDSCKLEHVSGKTDHASGNLENGSRKTDYVTGNPEHGSWKSDYVTGNPEHGSWKSDYVTGNPEHDSGKSDYVTGNPEHGSQKTDHASGNLVNGSGRVKNTTGKNIVVDKYVNKQNKKADHPYKNVINPFLMNPSFGKSDSLPRSIYTKSKQDGQDKKSKPQGAKPKVAKKPSQEKLDEISRKTHRSESDLGPQTKNVKRLPMHRSQSESSSEPKPLSLAPLEGVPSQDAFVECVKPLTSVTRQKNVKPPVASVAPETKVIPVKSVKPPVASVAPETKVTPVKSVKPPVASVAPETKVTPVKSVKPPVASVAPETKVTPVKSVKPPVASVAPVTKVTPVKSVNPPVASVAPETKVTPVESVIPQTGVAQTETVTTVASVAPLANVTTVTHVTGTVTSLKGVTPLVNSGVQVIPLISVTPPESTQLQTPRNTNSTGGYERLGNYEQHVPRNVEYERLNQT